MKLILGGINGEFLADLLLEAEREIDGRRRTEEVWAGVAYAAGFHHSGMLLNWCFEKNVPLKFWGRLDETVPVEIEILNAFLKKKSPDFVCKLVKHHHAKVIWWRGFGIYIGSANLTYPAWNKNVEAGCYFDETELSTAQIADFEQMFATLDTNAAPLTDELRDLMIERAKRLKKAEVDDRTFWSHPSVRHWNGLIVTTAKKASDRRREDFLYEWNETLQLLRDIAARVSQSHSRPAWVDVNASVGAQADQFLHAHYYHQTFDGRRAMYASYYEENRNRREQALTDAIAWWHQLPKAPSDWPGEDVVINGVSRELADLLQPSKLPNLEFEDFRTVAGKVYAMGDFARRARNSLVKLPEGVAYTIPEKLDALCKLLWEQRTQNGSTVLRVLDHILYGGAEDLLPDRLWQAVADPAWKLEGMGISTLGELVGWAMPDKFPPRNGRTSKALRSLGYDVRVHV